MTNQEIINSTVEYFKEQLSGETTGHDWFHIQRVWKLSKAIANKEGKMNMFVVEMGALLHDIADHKFHGGDDKIGAIKAREYLEKFEIDSQSIDKIVQIVEEISFKGLKVPTIMSTKEGEIVQDADRLDAIGAIGVARAFAYGGSKNRPIYNPIIKPVCHTSFAAYKTSTAPTINHFYEKLLGLKDRLNTEAGKIEGERRHAFMEEFLKNFYKDWDANIS
ncbi:MAG: phosphohydrolase [Bacteroidetes bacterium]|nr:MAG: phosphohydrolase [Bacteroidota bacterium]